MSDQAPDSTGPSHETLANLKAMLPSFIKAMRKKKILGKGVPAMSLRPRKVCKVCGLLFDKAMIKLSEDVEIVPDLCGTCRQALDDGFAAIVCGERYALVKAKALSDWAGQVKKVSPHVMDLIEKKYNPTAPSGNGTNPAQN